VTDPSADSISVDETLRLLDGPFAPLAEGVANGHYVCWLGSGISRGRVADLGVVVVKVLDFLQRRIDSTDPGCPFRTALERAVEVADLRDDERALVDFDEPVASWPVVDVLIRGLSSRYSELLDIRVDRMPADYLLWEAVDIPATYPAGAPPDCEHLCLAILALEGVLPNAPSANWDGLIESALAEITGDPDSHLRVVVLAEDFRETGRPSQLLKFHGCAIHAARDPDRYRAALVASRSQITRWSNDGASELMRETLVALATTRPTLMIGLSAQDDNIQAVFAAARERMDWDWPSDPPAHVFAGDELGPHHRNILKVVYGDHYEEHGAEIEEGALLRAYAQQLLTALVLYVLAAKLRAYISAVDAPGLDESARARLAHGVRVLRDFLGGHAEPDRLAFIRGLAGAEARAAALFQEGVESRPGGSHYTPLSNTTADRVSADPNIVTSGMRELSAALGLLGRGQDGGDWQVATGPTGAGHEGMLKVLGDGGRESGVFFVANGYAAVQLETGGTIDRGADDVVMIHSTEPVGTLARSPRGRFGRTGRTGIRHVDMRQLLATSRDLTDLDSRFRHSAAL
jgi:hypothetical protein